MFHLSDFLIYCFVTAYTPGANNLLSMSNAVRLGIRRSYRFNLGILAGFVIVMTACMVFSTTLFALLPKFKFVMQILGAGMILQFANPKIYIYAVTAMTLYILPVYHSAGALIGFTILLALVGASGSFVWALCGSVFCKYLSRHTKGVNIVMALLLIYCAGSLFL